MTLENKTLLGKIAELRELDKEELQLVNGGDDSTIGGTWGRPRPDHMCAPTGSNYMPDMTDCD